MDGLTDTLPAGLHHPDSLFLWQATIQHAWLWLVTNMFRIHLSSLTTISIQMARVYSVRDYNVSVNGSAQGQIWEDFWEQVVQVGHLANCNHHHIIPPFLFVSQTMHARIISSQPRLLMDCTWTTQAVIQCGSHVMHHHEMSLISVIAGSCSPEPLHKCPNAWFVSLFNAILHIWPCHHDHIDPLNAFCWALQHMHQPHVRPLGAPLIVYLCMLSCHMRHERDLPA